METSGGVTPAGRCLASARDLGRGVWSLSRGAGTAQDICSSAADSALRDGLEWGVLGGECGGVEGGRVGV